MADTAIHLGETPEQVAFKLFIEVAYAEEISLYQGGGGSKSDRKWILDTYAECLKTVTSPSGRSRT